MKVRKVKCNCDCHTDPNIVHMQACCDEGIITERIYSQEDEDSYSVEWMKGLNESGYAGIKSNGNIVDRREFSDAVPIQANTIFGIIKPKEL